MHGMASEAAIGESTGTLFALVETARVLETQRRSRAGASAAGMRQCRGTPTPTLLPEFSPVYALQTSVRMVSQLELTQWLTPLTVVHGTKS